MSTRIANDANASSAERPTPWEVWFRAIRFFSFTTSTVPVLAASALAIYAGRWNPWYLLLMIVASMATHAGCNLANDLFDDETGVDRVQRVGTGGMLQKGWLTKRQLAVGIVVAFLIALVAALPIMIDLGTPIVVLAVVSAAAAFFYTGGPFPLAYWALGEVTVFLAMGVGLVGGTFYVHTGEVSGEAIMLGAALGSLAAAILHANNFRDRETDHAHHKRTIANLTSERFARAEFRILVLAPLLIVPFMIADDVELWPVALVLIAVPRIIKVYGACGDASSTKEFNLHLRQTAGLHMQFGLLTTAGVLVAAIVGAL